MGCKDPADPKNQRPGPKPPNVIVISLDTLRADHLGCYGYSKPTSPFLDSLAEKKGVVLFEQCISQAPNTAPSHMSLFTSLYPSVHAIPNIIPSEDSGGMVLNQAVKPMAQVFKEAGYQTIAVTDGGYLSPLFGFSKGFDSYHCLYENVEKKITRAITALNSARSQEAPFFLFLHTYETHAPYVPPEPFRSRFSGSYNGWLKPYCFAGKDAIAKNKHLNAFKDIFKKRDTLNEEDVRYLKGLYDGEIAYTDHELKKFWRYLEKKQLLDNTCIIILSDHGEEFKEHGDMNHKQLYDEVVHVPLIFQLPKVWDQVKRKRISAQVSLIDVLPTLTDLLSVKKLPFMQGRSLRPAWEREQELKNAPAFTSIISHHPTPHVVSIRHEDKKLMEFLSGKAYFLFDLSNDPKELNNCLKNRPNRTMDLYKTLLNWRRKNKSLREDLKSSYSQEKMDKRLIQDLEQLGY